MLEGVGVAVEVVVAVVFVEEEVVFESEDELVGDAGFGESDGVDRAGVGDLEYVFWVVGDVFGDFVAQVAVEVGGA